MTSGLDASESGTAMTLKRAVFLDRDGVLIRSFERNGVPHPPASLEEVEVLPGVVDACQEFRAAGWHLICVTNQPDIARGVTDPEFIRATNTKVQSMLGLDDVLVCPHDDADACGCRKPQPGLLTRGAARWDVSLSDSVMVGDRWRDIAAGRHAGCRTVFVDHDYTERKPEYPDLTVRSLRESTAWILATTARR